MLEESRRLGNDVGITHRWVFLSTLMAHKSNLFTKAKIEEITDNGVKVNIDGKSEFIEADTIIPVNITNNPELPDLLKDKNLEMYLAGDGNEPGKLMEAITSGFIAGQSI